MGEQVGWHHLDEQPQSGGDKDQIVEQTKDRNEIRDQIDRRKSIGCNQQPEQADRPSNRRIARGEPDGMRVNADFMG